MNSASMKSPMKFLRTFSAARKTKKKGIADSLSEDELLAKVITVSDKWDTLELEKKKTECPKFSHYFQTYIQEDLKNGMLLSVRRQSGLGDEFFYNTPKSVVTSNISRRLENLNLKVLAVIDPA